MLQAETLLEVEHKVNRPVNNNSLLPSTKSHTFDCMFVSCSERTAVDCADAASPLMMSLCRKTTEHSAPC